MSNFFLFIGVITLLVIGCLCDDVCAYGNVNLTMLADTLITCEQKNQRYTLNYTPCRNKIGCEGQVMMAQFANNGGPCQYNVATYDEKVAPKAENGGYTFEYANGPAVGTYCSGGRAVNITFICEQGAVPYNANRTECDDEPSIGPPEDRLCLYYFNVYTQAAC